MRPDEAGSRSWVTSQRYPSRSSHPLVGSDETLQIEKQVTEKRSIAPLPAISRSGSSNDCSAKENGLYWEGYLDEEYADKRHPKLIRNLRYMFFSVYRRLFGITFAANMAVFIALIGTHQANTGKIAYAVLSNFTVSILIRQEYIINTLFAIFTAWPSSTPLAIRKISARIFHIGGRKCRLIFLSRHAELTRDTPVHSGCSISGTIWFVLFVAIGTREYTHGTSSVCAFHRWLANSC